MRKIRVFLMSVCVLASLVSMSQGTASYTAETASEGVTNSFLPRSATAPCAGTASWRSSGFYNLRTYVWRSPGVTFGTGSYVEAWFTYNIGQSVGGTAATYTLKLDLYQSGAFIANLKTVTGTGSTSGCVSSGIGSYIFPSGFPAGLVELRITATTTNTNASGSNLIQVDNVGMNYGALASTQQGNGLTQPSYSAGYRNTFKYSSGDMYGDVFVTKSAQSATSCPGVSDPEAPAPICSYASVIGWHEVKKIHKTTGDIQYGVQESFTVPYQTGTWELALDNVQLEDASYYWVHYFTIPTVDASGQALEWKTYEVAQAPIASAPLAMITEISSNSGSLSTVCTLGINQVCYGFGAGLNATLYQDRALKVPMATTGSNYKRVSDDGQATSYRIKIDATGKITYYVECL